MVMTAPITCRFILSRAAPALTLAFLVGPAGAHKDPVTPQLLNSYQEVFMEQVRKGDLLFHGDAKTEEAMGVCTENLIRVDDVMESPKLAE
jgi:thiosulfate dehydrogenase